MIALDVEAVASVGPGVDAYVALAAEASRRRRYSGEPMACEEFQATCPLLARPVAIALWNVGTGRGQVGYDVTLLGTGYAAPDGWEAVPCGGETVLLTWAHTTLTKFPNERLLTFQGRGYDLPLLWHRARIRDVPIAPVISLALGQKPWESKHHLDLAHALAFDGAMNRYYSLRAHALAYGLDDPKAGGSGADIAALVDACAGEAVLRYVCGDVAATVALARRTGHAGPAAVDPAQPSLFVP